MGAPSYSLDFPQVSPVQILLEINMALLEEERLIYSRLQESLIQKVYTYTYTSIYLITHI